MRAGGLLLSGERRSAGAAVAASPVASDAGATPANAATSSRDAQVVRTRVSGWTDPMAFDTKAWSDYAVVRAGRAARQGAARRWRLSGEVRPSAQHPHDAPNDAGALAGRLVDDGAEGRLRRTVAAQPGALGSYRSRALRLVF